MATAPLAAAIARTRTLRKNNQNRAAARNTVQQPCFMVEESLLYVCAPETPADISGALFTAVCSERTALGGVDGDGAQKILQRLLVGGAANVQLL